MLKAAQRAGFSCIMCTPHCRWDDFSPKLVKERYLQLQEHAVWHGIQLGLGYEVYWAKLLELGLATAPSLCFEGTNTLLLEFSTARMPSNWQSLIYELQGMGLEIIIAHPERYRAVQEDIGIARELHDMGCSLQLSANFVKGGFPSARRATAKKLMKAGLIGRIASDAHGPEDYEQFLGAARLASRYLVNRGPCA